jgi:hypothetical protein
MVALCRAMKLPLDKTQRHSKPRRFADLETYVSYFAGPL